MRGFWPTYRTIGWSDIAVYLVAAAGLAASITVVFLGMRAVMDVGGYCAEGGPSATETRCPEEVPVLLALAFVAMFAFGGLAAYRGARLGSRYVSAVLLAWPALFLSLGWNFLQYGLKPPGSDGVAWGWLVCAGVFVVMGVAPLAFGVASVPRLISRSIGRPTALWLAQLAISVGVGILAGFLIFRSFPS